MSGSIYLGASEQSVAETDGFVYVTVVRTGDTSSPVTVTYGLTADNATPGTDYIVPASNTVIIPAGQNYAQVPIAIVNDSLSEPTESFVFSIINVSSGTLLAPRTDRIYILDDENPAVLSGSPPMFSNYNVSQQTVISGLVQPIKFEFSPVNPSLMYIAEKGGAIKVYNKDTGAFVSTFIDLSSVVNQYQDRGLMDIALHPNFPASPYIYAFYVVDPPDTAGKTGNDGPDGGGNRFAYVVRYTADAATNYTTVVPGSGVILVGNTGQTLGDISGNGALDFTDPANSGQTASDIYLNPARGGTEPVIGGFKQNYLKVDSRSHAGGALAFGPDGMLYVSVGDGTSFDFADPRGISVQNLNSFAGKILRIDPMTGLGLSDNPYAAGQPLDSDRAKIYQLGLRNPFSMGFDSSGRLFISDTGWNTWEEINSGPAGANFGWPYYEGGDNGINQKTGDYQDFPTAAAFYAAVQSGSIVITPAYSAFSHSSSVPGYHMQAITGGDVIYTGNRYPAAFQNDFFFSDFSNGNVFSIDTNDRRKIEFLYNAGVNQFGPVHFSQGPDGYVYAADLLNGKILRLLIAEYPKPAPRSWVPIGNAVQISASPVEYRLTIDDQDQLGAVTYSTRVDMRRDFTISFDAYLGLLDSGADGIGFVLQNANIGPYAHGNGGGAFGIQGLPNGIGIIIDTYANEGEINEDKTFFLNPLTGARTTEVALSNIENGNYHPVVVSWNATTKTLSYTIDGVQRGTLTDANFTTTYLGGSNFAYFGFGGATGGAVNEQRVRLNSLNVVFEHNLASGPDKTDFDGNNTSDFLWQNDNGQAAAWLLNGSTVTAAGFVGPQPSAGWKVVSSGDFNGDGRYDILWRNTTNGQAAVWFLNGLTMVSGNVVGNIPGTDWKVIGSGDFNGDGKSDILWQNTATRQAAVWMMDGLAVLSAGFVGGVPSAGWQVMGSGDFNGDGKSDILWQNTSTLQAGIWLLDGLSVLNGNIVGNVPSAGWKVAGAGDFNGDGKSDILWQNTASLQAAAWLMDGLNVTQAGIIGATPSAGWMVAGSGDYNNDGKSDIYWQHSGGQAAVWQVNGLTYVSGILIGNDPGPTWHLIGQVG